MGESNNVSSWPPHTHTHTTHHTRHSLELNYYRFGINPFLSPAPPSIIQSAHYETLMSYTSLDKTRLDF